MTRDQKPVSANGIIILFFVLVTTIGLRDGYIGNVKWHWMPIFALPLLLLAVDHVRKTKLATWRNFPLAYHLRHFLASFKPRPGQSFPGSNERSPNRPPGKKTSKHVTRNLN